LRLLHTSDWHLGQTLHNFDRSWEHQRFLDWLLETLVSEAADALLVSGDVFDNANPSAASQRMLYRFLADARARIPHLNIVLIAGNHDSPGRLEAPAPFLEAFDARVVGAVTRETDGSIAPDRMVVPLRDRQGEIAAWCLAVPFLRASDLPRTAAAESTEPAGGSEAALACPENREDPYLAGVGALYRQVREHALALRRPGQALVALGHCHMAGGQVSESSERRILVGGAEMLSADLFGPEVAYAALGHLHLAQPVGPGGHIRYCGSPLPLSFAEIHYPHQVLRVDLAGERLAHVASIHVPRSVPFLRVPPQPAPLADVETALAALDLEDAAPEARPLLEVRVRLDGPEPGLRARVEAALEGKPVRLARIDARADARSAAPEGADAPSLSLDDLGQLDPLAIFHEAYRRKYDQDPAGALVAALTEILNAPEEVAP
jgi:exonuclease SbcD